MQKLGEAIRLEFIGFIPAYPGVWENRTFSDHSEKAGIAAEVSAGYISQGFD